MTCEQGRQVCNSSIKLKQLEELLTDMMCSPAQGPFLWNSFIPYKFLITRKFIIFSDSQTALKYKTEFLRTYTVFFFSKTSVFVCRI